MWSANNVFRGPLVNIECHVEDPTPTTTSPPSSGSECMTAPTLTSFEVGGKISSLKFGITEEECRADCCADYSCRAWAYDVLQQHCWIKTTTGVGSANAAFNSGYKYTEECRNDVDGGPQVGVKLHGFERDVTSSSTEEMCRDECCHNNWCVGWMYNPSLTECTVMARVDSTSPDVEVISASKFSQACSVYDMHFSSNNGTFPLDNYAEIGRRIFPSPNFGMTFWFRTEPGAGTGTVVS